MKKKDLVMIDCSRSIETPFAVFKLLIIRIKGIDISGDFVRSKREWISFLHSIFVHSKCLANVS